MSAPAFDRESAERWCKFRQTAVAADDRQSGVSHLRAALAEIDALRTKHAAAVDDAFKWKDEALDLRQRAERAEAERDAQITRANVLYLDKLRLARERDAFAAVGTAYERDTAALRAELADARALLASRMHPDGITLEQENHALRAQLRAAEEYTSQGTAAAITRKILGPHSMYPHADKWTAAEHAIKCALTGAYVSGQGDVEDAIAEKLRFVTIAERFDSSKQPEIGRLRADNAKLRAFAWAVLDDGDGSWTELQDEAEDAGLLAPVEVTEACGEACACADCGIFPATCYRPMAALGARP